MRSWLGEGEADEDEGGEDHACADGPVPVTATNSDGNWSVTTSIVDLLMGRLALLFHEMRLFDVDIRRHLDSRLGHDS